MTVVPYAVFTGSGRAWQQSFVNAARPGQTLDVDLSQQDMLDSAALGRLLSTHRQLRQRGSGLVLHNTGPRLQRVLRISGLDRLFAA